MANEEAGVVSAGAGRMWRRQRILWWVFAVNFILAALGTVPAVVLLRRAIGNSLAGQQLVKRFDLGIFLELIRLPQVHLMRATTSSYLFAGLFALFMLFVTGGILDAYWQDRELTTGEFFASSGAYFWPFVRLALLSIIPFAIVAYLNALVMKLSEYVADTTVNGRNGFYVHLAGTIIIVLLALLVRVWYDLAKVRAVAVGEHKMWRSLWRAYTFTRHSWGSLLWMYFRISLVAWIVFAVGLFIWTKVPPAAVGLTFLIFEVMLLVQVGTRLWQLASATAWYSEHQEPVPAIAVEFTAPVATEAVEPELGFGPGTELPPADA